MSNRIIALIASVFLLVQPVTAYAQAADAPNLVPSVIIQFGESIEFSIAVDSDIAPVRAALFLRSSSDAQYEVYLVDIEAGNNGGATRRFTPQSINLRPFQQFEYYWQVDFADGSVVKQDPMRMTYHDDRFSWQELSQGNLTIWWVDGDAGWAQDIYTLTADVLPEIQRQLATSIGAPINVYVYPSQSDLQNSLRQAGINQASAHALPELGVVLVAGESDPETLIRFEHEIPHELVHLALYNRMGTGMTNLPVWLNEGLATRFEQSPRPIYSATLDEAASKGALLEIESLCSSFPIAETDRVLAYAQSASFTDYLFDVYGIGGINQLLDAYQEGTSCTGGIQRVYQRSLDQLEVEWVEVSFGNLQSVGQARTVRYAAIGSALIIFLLITALIMRRQRSRHRSG